MRPARRLITRLAVGMAGTIAAAATALGCGPFFPNSLLLGGDWSLLRAPLGAFAVELDHVPLPQTGLTAIPATNGLPNQTWAAEVSDLKRALEGTPLPPGELEDRVREFAAVRVALRDHAEALDQWREQLRFRSPESELPPRPRLGQAKVPAGLPVEFEDYLAGSIAFHAGETNVARQAWERLLARPASDRRTRSTWAAFMLGKTWLQDDPERAIEFFELVRRLAGQGYSDSLGLGAASLGWQAKAACQQRQFADALRLYLLQHRTGDATALSSLRLTVRALLEEPPVELERVAADPLGERVVTAYLIAQGRNTDLEETDERSDRLQRWLDAVEHAQRPEVPAAERLALVAYQAGRFDLAEGWLRRAPATSALAQWLRAKLLLRAGKLEPAARLLARVSRLFAREGDWADPPVVQRDGEPGVVQWDEASPIRRAMGEMGVLHLARREYYEALDLLLRSGHWLDAAYVAESVLTPDEAMAYTDRQWPAPEIDETSSPRAPVELEDWTNWDRGPRGVGLALRYLVARRLARLQRWNEAVTFYPEIWRLRLEAFVHALERGRDPALPAGDRAEQLWQAAQIARADGMELFGTELEPDWHVYGGQFESDEMAAPRAGRTDSAEPAASPSTVPARSQARLSESSPDEQRRIALHRLAPARRFHYRYLAAELGWEAAQLMPNQSEGTARVLWQAGSWLKVRDPRFADRFYKALVRRCRNTPLGQAADALRWFPKSPTPEPTTVPDPTDPAGASDAAPAAESSGPTIPGE